MKRDPAEVFIAAYVMVIIVLAIVGAVFLYFKYSD